MQAAPTRSVLLFQLQHELEQSLEECSDLTERLDVAHIERKDAIVEKDEIVLKYHAERERRRRAEKEVRAEYSAKMRFDTAVLHL